MNILMVPSWYKNETNSILGSFFREQALALTKMGHQVYVADATFQGADNLKSKRLFRLKKYNDNGLITYSCVFPALGIARLPSGGMGIYKRNLKKIFKAIKKDGVNIDLIQAHSFYPAGYGAVCLGKHYGIPTVVTEHNSLVLKKQLSPQRVAMLKATVEDADRFVCVSNALKKSVAEITKTNKKIEVLPNSVGHEFSCVPNSANETFTFASVGNLIPGKRFDLTLSAFAHLHSEKPNARLVIAGDGYLHEQLENQAKQLNISDSVRFLGRVPRENIVSVLQQSDAFVLPSDAETFGVVYIEALACGKPVIGAKNGGAEEIITDDNGILIDKNDVEQLYVAMRYLYDNISRFDGAEIAKCCYEAYGEESLSKRYIEIYHEILNK